MSFIFYSHLEFDEDNTEPKEMLPAKDLQKVPIVCPLWINAYPCSTYMKHLKLANSWNQRVAWWMPGAGGGGGWVYANQ